jgi:thioredoxin 1
VTLLTLDQVVALPVEQVGGKAKGLAQLARLGLPVPEARVLDAAAHAEFAQTGQLPEDVLQALAAAAAELGGPLAVRSSAADEDVADKLEGASHAIFWAPWCGPCRIIAPHLEELDSERDDLTVVKLNVDENPQTAAKYGIMSIPTLILFKNGQVAKQVVGALPKTRLQQELEPVLA